MTEPQPVSAGRKRRPQRRPAIVEGWILRALARMLALLPLGLVHGLGSAASRLAYPWAKATRTVIESNLKTAFPTLSDDERALLARDSYRHQLLLAMETGLLWHGHRGRWEKVIDGGSAMTRLEETLAAGQADHRGTLMLAPHFGNWELLSLLLGRYGLTALYDPPRLMSLEEPIRRARERAGATLLPIDQRGIRGILKALGRGGFVAVLPDQVPDPAAGVYAPFFGRPTLTMTLVHRLLRKTRPRVVLVGLERRGDRFRLHCEVLDADSLAGMSAEACLAEINAATERLVATAPAQYQWAYKRYKRPPPGVPKLY